MKIPLLYIENKINMIYNKQDIKDIGRKKWQ